MKNNKMPEIRFSGFTEDWKQQKFKDFITKAGNKNENDENYTSYSVSNKLGLVSQTEQFDGSRLDNLDKTSYKVVNPNEFVYNPARVNVGSIAFNNLDKTVVVSSLYVVIKMSEKIDNNFILQFIKSPLFINEVKRNTEGSVREYLFVENFKNIKFPLTNKEEQKKIAYFFKQLDNTIVLHQRELDILKKTKEGFLQKMFPKEGESVPEIRFPGFTGDWEQRKLIDIVTRVSVQSNNKKYPVVEFEDIVSGEGRLNKDIFKKQRSKKGIIFQSGYILYGKLRPYLKNWLYADFDGIAVGDFWVLEANKSSSIFDYYLIQSERFQSVANLSTGTKMPRSDWKIVSNTNFFIPKIEEQTKIGSLFKQIDDIIALNQRGLELLKETKKAFLQKMFI